MDNSPWRLRHGAIGLLLVLALLAAWDGFIVNDRPETGGCGGDFPQYYVAGVIVHRGEATRLYDQPYFRHCQDTLRDDPLRSLYPPTMGLLMAPLARFSYSVALAAWWILQAVCLLATGWIFYRTATLPPAWRIPMLLALGALFPLWISVGIGHLAPMLLLILAGGLALHQRGNRGWAGLALALLAIKPQLAVGLVLWMLVRRDLRTLAGLAAGFALQALAVAAFLGPRLWLDYLHALPGIAAVTRLYHYSPLFEQSLPGIVSNLLGTVGLIAWQTPAMKITYVLTAGAAAVLLCRIVWARQKHPEANVFRNANYEYACGVLFMTIFPPYFLVYDQTLLAVVLVMLWSSPAWRWGVALFALMTVLAVNMTFALGFSLTGIAGLATMVRLTHLDLRPRFAVREVVSCRSYSQ